MYRTSIQYDSPKWVIASRNHLFRRWALRMRCFDFLIHGIWTGLAVLVLSNPAPTHGQTALRQHEAGGNQDRDFADGECHQIQLSAGLEWPTSGVWTDDQEELLVADPLAGQVTRISRHGHVETELAGELVRADGLLQPLGGPSQIRAAANGFLLEDERDQRLVRLNLNLEVVDTSPIMSSKRSEPLQRHVIYDWTPMGQGILAFSDLADSDGNWTSGFLYFGSHGRQEVFRKIAIGDEAADFYTRSTISYVAALEDVGYILALSEETVSIEAVQLGSKARRLMSIPAKFRNRPRLDPALRKRLECQGTRKTTEIYKSHESATMVSGIYAWDHDLYLLAKQAMSASGETAWWLIRLDPSADGKEISRVRLPTGAAHLTIVPGGDFWALIEKGRVEGVGSFHSPYMNTSSIILVPTAWLTKPSNRHLDPQLRRQCGEPLF